MRKLALSRVMTKHVSHDKETYRLRPPCKSLLGKMRFKKYSQICGHFVTRSQIVFLTSIWKKAGGMPTANRGRRLRRLSPVTWYAALSELPRGALKIITKRRAGRSASTISCGSKPTTALLIV